jgi:hypothetical protein
MDERKLVFTEPEMRDSDGYIAAPAVVETVDPDDNSPIYMATYGVYLEKLDGVPHVAIGNASGSKMYPLEGEDELVVDETEGKITFSSYGRIYTIRAFNDSDGVWASQLASNVPAEALEELYMTEVQNAFSPDAPAADENLYAAVDEDTNEVKNLVYSTASGLYIRDNGAWFKLPKDDESLDDLVVLEVDPKFIKIYDMAQGNDDMLLSDDVKKYEVEFRGALAEEAVEA